MSAGTVIRGGVWSATMTWKVVEAEWPLGSLAEQVTSVDPIGNVEPEAGVQLTATTPATASVAVGFVYVTTVPPGAAFAFTSGAGPKTGGKLSWTVTLNDLLALLPAPSVAVQTTVVSPMAKVEPEPGTQLTGTEAPRSVAVGVPNVTVRPPGDVASTEMSLGTLLITGSVVSWTMTLKEVEAGLPFPSLASHSTEVVPIAKVEPDTGEQVTVGFPATASVAVGFV